jgi:hypothetical protein
MNWGAPEGLAVTAHMTYIIYLYLLLDFQIQISAIISNEGMQCKGQGYIEYLYSNICQIF